MTWGRDSPLVDKGWVTPQQGTIDVQTLKAQEAAVASGRKPMQRRNEAQIQVLTQQKAYQRVVAPFDGVITQRNVDVGSARASRRGRAARSCSPSCRAT